MPRPDFLKETLHPQGPTSQVNDLKRAVNDLQRNPTPIPSFSAPVYAQLLRLGVRQIQSAFIGSDFTLGTSLGDVTGAEINMVLNGGLCLVFWRAALQLTQGSSSGTIASDIYLQIDSVDKDLTRTQHYVTNAGVIEHPVNGWYIHSAVGDGASHNFKLRADRLGGSAGYSGKLIATGATERTGLMVVELDTDPGLLYLAERSKRATT